jgi:hypothetical protein
MRIRCLAFVFVIACGHHDDGATSKTSSTPPTGTQPSGAQASNAPTQSAGIEIVIDDKSVARVRPEQLAGWPRLDTLVPVSARHLGSWQDLSIQAAAETKQLHKPSDTYRDLVPVVYPGDDGAPAFGMFDPVELAKHGKPQLAEQHVTQVRITLAQGGGRGENENGEGGGADPTKLQIAIKTPTGSSMLEGSKLLAIPREPMPGDAAKDPRGWSLSKILDAAGIKKFHKVMLGDVEGNALTLEPADFNPTASIPFVKLNRQGSLRVTVYKKQGEGWQRAGDLRGLASIEVLK